MDSSDLRARADQRFEQALARTGARDPRDFYRQRLRELKEQDADAFRRAVAYHDAHLVPSVAGPDSDPVAEWLEYGRVLASFVAPGETVQIDPSGLAAPYTPPVPLDYLVLHLPSDTRHPALIVGLPATLSPAQRATHDLLVRNAQE